MANTYIYNINDTWNDVNITFDGIKLTVNDATSDANSNLFSLNRNSVNYFKVGKGGNTTILGSLTLQGLSFSNTTFVGLTLNRLTTAQISGISSPLSGSLVYDSTLNYAKYYNGTTWKIFSSIGGSDGTIQYNANNIQEGMSGTAWNDTNRSLTISGATITSSSPIFNLSQTWNNASATFTGMLLNFSNTASAAGSKLMEIQFGGASRFTVFPSSSTNGNSGILLGPNSSSGTRLISASGPLYCYVGDLTAYAGIAVKEILLGGQTKIVEDAINIVSLRNSTSAQTYRIYNTYTDGSNYERFKLGWSSNILEIGTESLGTGTLRTINFIGGNIGVGMTSPTARFHVYEQKTDTASSYKYLCTNDLSIQPASASLTNFISQYNYALTSGSQTIYRVWASQNIVQHGSSANLTTAYSLYNSIRNYSTNATIATAYVQNNEIEHSNSANSITTAYVLFNSLYNNKTSGTGIGSAYGTYNAILNTGGGNITSAYAERNSIQNGAGTITAAYGLQFDISNAGTITTWYGIHMSDSGAGTITNRYPIYISSTGLNYIEGNTGIGTSSPSAKLDINSDTIRLRTSKTPASASASGTQGEIAWDASYVYVCTATNTWKRSAIATW